MCNFLMHAGEGKYRDALVDYLVAFYAGRDSAVSLFKAPATSYPDLDRGDRQFMQESLGRKPVDTRRANLDSRPREEHR